MPTVKSKPPEALRPYLFHGLDLSWTDGDREAVGDCPFCGREEKFSVDTQEGLWICRVCGEGNKNGGGNAQVFLRVLHEFSVNATSDYSALANSRGMLCPDVLVHWEVCRSITTGRWMIPGYGPDGKMNQLYQYMTAGPDRVMKLLPTPTLGHQLHGVNLYRKDRSVVYLCEGPWDAMTLWEVLGKARPGEEGLGTTATQSKSLLNDANVLAVPGCSTFFPSWLPLFSGKTVCLMYDSDHPREHPKTGKPILPAGFKAVKRISSLLSSSRNPPDQIRYLRWGPEGYDPERPSGTDIRDYLSNSKG